MGKEFWFEDSYVGHVAVKFVEVEAVADDKFVGDIEADVIYGDIYGPTRGFVEEGADFEGGGRAGQQLLAQIGEGVTAVYDVFDDEDVVIGNRPVQIHHNSYFAAAACAGAIAGYGHEIY